MVDIVELPGRGLGLVATRLIPGGEVVLSELPLLVYPQQSMSHAVCHHCLRFLGSSGVKKMQCMSCSNATFCSASCAAAAAADPGSHCLLVCRAFAACNLAGLSDDQQTALQYLVRASSLLLSAHDGNAAVLARWVQLQRLSLRCCSAPCAATGGAHGAAAADGCSLEVRELHGRLQHALATAIGSALSSSQSGALAPSLSETAALLERDAVNSYGAMAACGSDGERRLRGGVLYATASRINHECLPNVARFDAFDSSLHDGAEENNYTSLPANTAIHFRALHAIPAGEEVTQSYFPLTWSYCERQRRCTEQYGFACDCLRCKEEATWPSSEEGDGQDVTATGPMEAACAVDAELDIFVPGDGALPIMDDTGAPAGGSGNDVVMEEVLAVGATEADAGYIYLFLMKYVCPREGCEGTMAPAAPGSTELECSVCGGRHTEQDFMKALEHDLL